MQEIFFVYGFIPFYRMTSLAIFMFFFNIVTRLISSVLKGENLSWRSETRDYSQHYILQRNIARILFWFIYDITFCAIGLYFSLILIAYVPIIFVVRHDNFK